jgi:membrane-associated PAP2 superfamily phosphatase
LAAWQYQQQQPWNILAAYGGALTGIGALGSSSSGKSSGTQFKAGFSIPGYGGG